VSGSSLRDLGDPLVDQRERAGVQLGRGAQLREGRLGAVDADRVAGAVLELVEEARDRVARLVLAGAAPAGLADRLRGAGGLGDRVCVRAGDLVLEEQLGPGVAQVPAHVLGEHADQQV
jgi:hypothetical protein